MAVVHVTNRCKLLIRLNVYFQLKAQFDQERIAVIYVDNDNDEVSFTLSYSVYIIK